MTGLGVYRHALPRWVDPEGEASYSVPFYGPCVRPTRENWRAIYHAERDGGTELQTPRDWCDRLYAREANTRLMGAYDHRTGRADGLVFRGTRFAQTPYPLAGPVGVLP